MHSRHWQAFKLKKAKGRTCIREASFKLKKRNSWLKDILASLSMGHKMIPKYAWSRHGSKAKQADTLDAR